MSEKRSLLPPKPRLIVASRGLFVLLAILWTVLAVGSVLRPPSGMAGGVLWVVVGLMVGNVAALLLSAWGMGRGGRRFTLFAIAVVGVNLILSVTDEFGVLDLVSLLLDGVLLLVLVASLFATGFTNDTD